MAEFFKFTSAADAPAAPPTIHTMGFDQDMVQQALVQAGGNEELAINLILNEEVHDAATISGVKRAREQLSEQNDRPASLEAAARPVPAAFASFAAAFSAVTGDSDGVDVPDTSSARVTLHRSTIVTKKSCCLLRNVTFAAQATLPYDPEITKSIRENTEVERAFENPCELFQNFLNSSH